MEIVKFTRDNAFQRIKAWYLDETIELSKKDIEIKDRLLQIHAWRRNNKYSPSQTISKIQAEFKVSQATAYRNYRLSMELFGNIDEANISAERSILAESYWNLYQLALKNKELETARKCLDSYKSLFNFHDNDQKVDPKKLEASVFNIKTPRTVNKAIEAMAKKGVIDLMSIGAQDVDFKEVSKSDEESVDDWEIENEDKDE